MNFPVSGAFVPAQGCPVAVLATAEGRTVVNNIIYIVGLVVVVVAVLSFFGLR